MKRIITFLYAIALIVFVSGCGAESSAAYSAGEAPQGSVSASGEPAESPAAPSAAGAEEENPGEPPAEYAVYNWEFDTPENHGVNSDMLENFHNAIAGDEIRSAVTVKDGYIIDEYYKDGYDENSVFGMASCTKTFSGALIGIAVDQGFLSGVDAKLTEFFPQLREPEQADKQDITVEHLLTHTSGIYWNEWNGGDYFRRLSRSENWVDFVLSQDMAYLPGTAFHYTTGGSHLLGAVIQEAAGMSEYEFGVEYLFKPLGMESVEWRSDPQGITDGGNGISMTARDAAKFGQLYLDGGKWNGNQIIPEDWVSQSVTVQFARSGNTGSYGYQWWIRPFGEKNYDTYYAMGHGGQYIFVVPELNLVTVMASRTPDTYTPQYYFNDYVIAACG